MKPNHCAQLRIHGGNEQRFKEIADRLGSNHVEVASRLVKWYARQDDSIQLAIFYNSDGAIREMLLRSLAKKKARRLGEKAPIVATRCGPAWS